LHGSFAHLADARAFKRFLRPVRRRKWFVYAKRPFAGPKAVLAYLSRYTHRVAISNRRLVKADANGVSLRVKDYRASPDRRWRTMTLPCHEFIRRFLIHVLPDGFHRIRHYGLLASAGRKTNVAKIRALLGAETVKQDQPSGVEIIPLTLREPCPDCGGPMRIIEIFQRGQKPRSRAPPRQEAA
jgi:hypothetical protein